MAVGCGGGDGDRDGAKLPAGAVTVYVSAPTHGPAAIRGLSAIRGARLALRRAGDRVGGRRVRMVALSSNREGDLDWDAGTVEANARRAVADPRAVAYVGELDGGGSAVSLPKTNAAGILQVAPADGLTSLTRALPARPATAPARLYPRGRRTFVSLVAPDTLLAGAMVRAAAPSRTRRVALVEGTGAAEREMATDVADRMRRARVDPVATEDLRADDPDPSDEIRKVAAARPEAVIVTAQPQPVVTGLLRGLARQLPGATLLGSPALARARVPGTGDATALTPIVPAPLQSPRARRVLRGLGPGTTAEALYGYDAMRLVLSALRSAGGDRAAIVRAARRPRTVSGLPGRFTVLRSGAARRPDAARVRLADRSSELAPVGP